MEKIEERVSVAKENPQALEELIKDFQAFIAKTTADQIGHWVEYGQDEELTIAMLAFSEAVKGYESSRGSFVGFATHVIRLRLIDFYRKRSRKHQEEIKSIERCMETGESLEFDLTMHRRALQTDTLRSEILMLKDELETLNISFKYLAEHSPKQERLKKAYIKVARWLAFDQERVGKIRKTALLPAKEIQMRFLMSKKTVERGRVFILACMLVITGDYEMIQDYLDWK